MEPTTPHHAPRRFAGPTLNTLRDVVALVYPLALLAGLVWLFARFGPGWGLVAVLALGALLLFNRPPAAPGPTA